MNHEITRLSSAMASKRMAVCKQMGTTEYHRQSLGVRKILKELMAEFSLPATSVALALADSDSATDHDRDLILAALVDELASTLVAEVH